MIVPFDNPSNEAKGKHDERSALTPMDHKTDQ